MKIAHRISGSRVEPFWREIDKLGIEYEGGKGSDDCHIVAINVTEAGHFRFVRSL